LNVWLAGLAILLTISIIGISSQEAFAGTVPPIQVTLDKTVNKPIVVSGTTVEYSYTIKNTGQNTIFCGAVEDDNGTDDFPPGSGNDDHTILVNTLLKTNEEITVMNSVVITQDTTNKAVVNCVADGNVAVVGESSTDVDVVNPSATIDKTASKTQGVIGVDPLTATALDSIFFAYDVENTGDVNLTGCTVSDSQAGLGIVNDIPDPFTPGDTHTVFSTNQKTFPDDAQNTGTLNCNIPTSMGDVLSPVKDTADVIIVDPMITIDKAASKTQGVVGVDPLPATANDDIFYSYVVKNTGDVALTGCVVTDDEPGIGVNSNIPSPLAPNQEVNVFSTVGKKYAANNQNEGTVTCNDVAMVTPSDKDTADVTIVNLMLTLGKTASETQGVIGVDPLEITAGTNVFYAYKATSNADVTLNNCKVNDNLLGAIPGTFNIPPGQMATFFSVIPAIINQNTQNTGTITCDPIAMVTPMAQNTANVNIKLIPCVDLVKMVDKGLIERDETVKYTFDATNCGVVPLKDCNINDVPLGPIGDADFLLPASVSKTFEKSVVINVDTTNTATIVCLTDDEAMNMVMDMDSAKVTIIVVGGEFLSIDNTALFLGGIQSSAVWILPTVAGLAGAGYYLVKFRNKED